MPTSRKRRPSITIQGPLHKQQRSNSPIIISDDSDDDIRHKSPPRLTAKQKGKRRASPQTDDPPRRLSDIDVISIPDDEVPILPALSRHQTPEEVLHLQSSGPLKETFVEFEALNEALSPDQILEQFKDVFFGERKCSQCEKPIQPVPGPVCGWQLTPLTPLICGNRRSRQISRTS
jgi:hypothetical protein